MGEWHDGGAVALDAARRELLRLQNAVEEVANLLGQTADGDMVAAWRAIEELRAARHDSEALLRDVQELADRRLDAIDLVLPARPASGMFVRDEAPQARARSTKA